MSVSQRFFDAAKSVSTQVSHAGFRLDGLGSMLFDYSRVGSKEVDNAIEESSLYLNVIGASRCP